METQCKSEEVELLGEVGTHWVEQAELTGGAGAGPQATVAIDFPFGGRQALLVPDGLTASDTHQKIHWN